MQRIFEASAAYRSVPLISACRRLRLSKARLRTIINKVKEDKAYSQTISLNQFQGMLTCCGVRDHKVKRMIKRLRRGLVKNLEIYNLQ